LEGGEELGRKKSPVGRFQEVLEGHVHSSWFEVPIRIGYLSQVDF
jgi:hypothetical protein